MRWHKTNMETQMWIAERRIVDQRTRMCIARQSFKLSDELIHFVFAFSEVMWLAHNCINYTRILILYG